VNSRPSDSARSDASSSTSTSSSEEVSGGPPADAAARAEALRDALIARSLVTAEALDEVVHEFTDVLTPRNGAIVVARCWIDPAFRARFLADATAASAELDIAGPEGKRMRAVENTKEVHNVIVCTQCSCTA
jgi:nitrile hydratase subunit alpha